MPPSRQITLDGFLGAFWRQDRNQPDRPFCFILGAGASKPSAIRTGRELARQFVEEIHKAEDLHNETLEKWSSASDGLGLTNFRLDRVEEFYPQLYERMFGDRLDEGYAFLEKEMEGREPSYGYSVLAWILAKTPHKVVITPNFDNLVADALSIYSSTFPRIVGHDSLAGFVRAELRRPLIAKVHGDLGFTLRNTPNEIARLSKNWTKALERVLDLFTPIVIGYGGNDGSLMGALERLPKGVPASIYWCQRESDPASDRVIALLEKRKGRLVVIPGFDELMLKLQDQMLKEWKMPDLLQEMEKRQRQREVYYREQRDAIARRLVAPRGAVRAASIQIKAGSAPVQETRDLAGAAVRVLAPTEGEKPWWQWYQEADAQADLDKREAIYRAALKALPDSAELLGSYAIFLEDIRGKPDQAEKFYQRAIAADPKNPNSLNNYAVFLDDAREDPDRAEKTYKQAIAADPKDATILGNYAIFLETAREDADRAEQFYKRAIAADPKQATNLGNYGDFLEKIRENPNRAEQFYKRAIAADPEDATNLGNYALFLENLRKDPDRVEQFYKRAIEADPKDATSLGNYALFLEKTRENPDRAEQFYQRAIAADPQHATNLGNYGDFLEKTRSKVDRAEEFYKRAIAADPNDATNLSTYANFLQGVRKAPARAEQFHKRAVAADPKDATNLGSYAVFLESVRRDMGRAEEFYKRAIAADPKHATNLRNYALFLENVRKDVRRAEPFYKRAVAADSKGATSLGTYALFLEKKDRSRAEQFYKRAIAADPKDTANLSNYAAFLDKMRRDPTRAQQFYQRAIAIDPKDATSLGNYAGLLLGLNKHSKGVEMLKRAEAALGDESALSVELTFYRLAHDPSAWPKQIQKLRFLLQAGARSLGWPFDRNIERAAKDDHPNVALLRALAKVINEEAPLDSLDGFPDWQNARPPRGKKKS